MKRYLSLLLFLFLIGAQYNVNAQGLTVSDIQNSGCLRETRETRAGDDDELEETRSIILTKEGNTLKVQLLNYIDNCGIWGFDVIPYVSGGSNGEPYTVSISVKSILGFDQAACICPYNVSFTLNGLETNSFNFSCYWCEGVVNLTEGEPLVIEDSWDDIGVNGLNYKIHKVMHSAKLSDGETWEGELNIPSEINYEGQKYTVTSIDDNAFVNNTALTSVTIPSSVISIGYGAFKGCRNLANITIPNSVIWIDTNAFNNTAWYNNQPDGVVYAGRIAYKCKGTMPEGTNITIKEGTYAIANEAFHNCNGLASVTIPGSVTLIGDSSFKGCGNLASVTISEGVVSIGKMAFRDCSSLESINIPKSITKIADGTFWGCKSLASVNLSEGLTRMGIFVFADCPSLSSITIPGSLANAREYTFTGCTNLTSVVFSEGVKTIEQSIFFHCDNLSTISIPKSIKSIYGYAFSALSNLTDFYCFADSVPKISKETFYDTPIASATLHVPEGSIEKYKATSPWKDFGNIVALEEEQAKLIICVANNDETAPIDTLYTEDEILWFNDKTREIKFKYSDEEVRKKLWSKSKYLEFRLGENVLFKATRTSIVMSNTYQDLVLCAGRMENKTHSSEGFFLYDCFPHIEKYLNDERTQTNIQKRAPQWEIFLKYWESKGKLHHDPIDLVSFSQGKRATIILPTMPDASKGKYYRLDRWENGKIIFEEEPNPQAKTPYIIVPKEDFSIDLNALDLDGLLRDTVSVKGASFIGSYCHEELSCQDGFYIDIIDATLDCQADDSNQRKAIVGALRACLIVSWDDPYNQGGSRGVPEKRELVLKDNPNGIESLTPNPSPSEKGTIYDLSGRKVNSQFSTFNSQLKQKGLYIQNGKKIIVK